MKHGLEDFDIAFAIQVGTVRADIPAAWMGGLLFTVSTIRCIDPMAATSIRPAGL